MVIEKCAGRAARYPAGDCTPMFDHIAVWAADTEASAKFLTEVMGWRRHPTVFHVSGDEKTLGGMIGTFFDAPGLWIELIEPTTPGPGMDILDQQGDGALVEINFDLGEAYGLALARNADAGIEMLSMDGSPLKNGGAVDEGVFDGEKILDGHQRIAYFPTELTHGTTIEYYEVLADNTGSLILERDRVWRTETRTPGTPWVDHVSIVTDDAGRAAAFFADHMGLQPRAGVTGEDGDTIIVMDANGADDTPLWLKLVQPAAGGRADRILKARGPGHIMELGVVVEDLAQFASNAARLGAILVDGNGSALDPAAARSLARAYVRPKDSCGIPICVVAQSVSADKVIP